jgi:hypothetical protein
LNGKQSRLVALVTVLGVSVALLGAAAPPDDRVLAVNQYTTEKGRTLAQTYARDLREINAGIYHCIPWVEIQKESIGFFRPKHLTGDDRYLSLRIYIEQDPSPAFARPCSPATWDRSCGGWPGALRSSPTAPWTGSRSSWSG